MSDIKCPYMQKESGGFFSSDTYTCTKIEHEVPYDTYDRYCTSYSYDDCPNYRYEKSSSSCYLTTVTCQILGLSDDNIYLQTLRKFRKDCLQKQPYKSETSIEKDKSKKMTYLEILTEYDEVGPIIARKMIADKEKKELAKLLLANYIAPITECLALETGVNYQESYRKAVKMYVQMTKSLIKRYHLETLDLTVPGLIKYDPMKDYSQMGHGKTLKK